MQAARRKRARQVRKFRTAHKYGAAAQGCLLGHSHRSKLEAAVCGLLELRRRAGEFRILEVEKHIRICGPEGHDCDGKQKIELVVDFQCTQNDGSIFFAEAKGFETSDWRIKRRLWIHHRTERLEIWQGSHTRPFLAETLDPESH